MKFPLYCFYFASFFPCQIAFIYNYSGSSYFITFFGPPPLGRKSPMKLCVSRSVGQQVSKQVFSKIVQVIYCKFYMKKEGLEDQNLIDSNLSEKFSFCKKGTNFRPNQGFLAFARKFSQPIRLQYSLIINMSGRNQTKEK